MPILLVTRPAPHKILLLVVSLVLGASYLIGVPPPTSIAATQPAWVIHVWAGAMLLSGSAGLFAAFWRPAATRALRMEGGAMDLGAAAMLLYAVSLVAYAGWTRALASGVTFGLWAAANLWRSRQIRRDLRELESG
jgi:hypothetical protein